MAAAIKKRKNPANFVCVIPNHLVNDTDSIPPAPLKKGGTGFKVPLFKGDLGGSDLLQPQIDLV
jgi:hypothetical protein